jgi:hypothetical protein
MPASPISGGTFRWCEALFSPNIRLSFNGINQVTSISLLNLKPRRISFREQVLVFSYPGLTTRLVVLFSRDFWAR